MLDWLQSLWVASGENWTLFVFWLSCGAFGVFVAVAWMAYGLGVVEKRLEDEVSDG